MTFLIPLLFLIITGFIFIRIIIRKQQLAYIENYHYPSAIKNKLLKKHPQLDEQQVDMVFKGLRQYFYICRQAKKRMVAMPSQVVDDAWHEFILFTRLYEKFCRRSMGYFLHHTPTEAMSAKTKAQDSIKRAWRLSCARENIDPKTPTQLPLLFALDSLLQIQNGFVYSLNCRDKNSPNYGDGYCAGDIACAAGCSGDSGSSDGGFFSSGSDADGCGGSGCGGD